jgi:cytochrome c-type biogenesis protein CcmF
MVVHLGVIMIAVGLAASNSYTHSATIPLPVGEERAWGGHTFELQRITQEVDDRASVVRAEVLLDGDKVYAPAITRYVRVGTEIATPSVRTGLTKDVYLTIAPSAVPPAPTDQQVTLRVFVKPMVLWLWIGGAVMAIGTILAAFPGRRRRLPTAAVSAPIGAPEPEVVSDVPVAEEFAHD